MTRTEQILALWEKFKRLGGDSVAFEETINNVLDMHDAQKVQTNALADMASATITELRQSLRNRVHP